MIQLIADMRAGTRKPENRPELGAFAPAAAAAAGRAVVPCAAHARVAVSPAATTPPTLSSPHPPPVLVSSRRAVALIEDFLSEGGGRMDSRPLGRVLTSLVGKEGLDRIFAQWHSLRIFLERSPQFRLEDASRKQTGYEFSVVLRNPKRAAFPSSRPPVGRQPVAILAMHGARTDVCRAIAQAHYATVGDLARATYPELRQNCAFGGAKHLRVAHDIAQRVAPQAAQAQAQAAQAAQATQAQVAAAYTYATHATDAGAAGSPLPPPQLPPPLTIPMHASPPTPDPHPMLYQRRPHASPPPFDRRADLLQIVREAGLHDGWHSVLDTNLMDRETLLMCGLTDLQEMALPPAECNALMGWTAREHARGRTGDMRISPGY